MINYGFAESVFWLGFATVLGFIFFLIFFFCLLGAVFSLVANMAKSLARERLVPQGSRKKIQEIETEEDFDNSNYPIG